MDQKIILKDDYSKTKKILYVLDTFPKISETFVLNEICHLLDLGLEIKIISLNRPQESIHNANFYKYNIEKRIKYFSQNQLIYRKNSVDQFIGDSQLIHAHFAYKAALCGRDLAFRLNLPFTVTIHAFEVFRKDLYKQVRIHYICKSAKLIFTPSTYNKKFIANLIAIDSEKIKVVRATINHHDFNDPYLKYDLKNKFIISYCGRLIEKKGIDYLLKSVAKLRETRQDFILNIIGTGHLEEALKGLATELKTEDFVFFLGEKTNESFHKILQDTSLFVSPCIVDDNGDRDVCPLTIQEAMAMHIPVISTNIASIPELIHHNESGFLVAEKNVTELTSAIKLLMDSSDLRQKFTENARKIIEVEFNNEVQTLRLVQHWDILLKQKMDYPAGEELSYRNGSLKHRLKIRFLEMVSKKEHFLRTHR